MRGYRLMPFARKHPTPVTSRCGMIEPLEQRVMLSVSTAPAAPAAKAVAVPILKAAASKPAGLPATHHAKTSLLDKAGSSLASLAAEFADFGARGGTVPGKFRSRDPALAV